MSTKTTFKRVALVTVAALGFGLLTSVSSNAAITSSFALNTTSQTVVGGGAAGDTPTALIRIDVTSDTLNGGLAASETITAAVTGVPTSVTAGPLKVTKMVDSTPTRRALPAIAAETEVVSPPAVPEKPPAALEGATESIPKPKAATVTSATRLKVVFVDICFLSISQDQEFPELGLKLKFLTSFSMNRTC